MRAGLCLAGLRWAFTTFAQSNWHPLTWLSLQLDAQLFGLHAGGFHLTNLLLHAANTLLLFGWLRRATGRALARSPGGLLLRRPSAARRVGGVGDRAQGRVEHLLSLPDAARLHPLRAAGGRRPRARALVRAGPGALRPGAAGQADARHLARAAAAARPLAAGALGCGHLACPRAVPAPGEGALRRVGGGLVRGDLPGPAHAGGGAPRRAAPGRAAGGGGPGRGRVPAEDLLAGGPGGVLPLLAGRGVVAAAALGRGAGRAHGAGGAGLVARAHAALCGGGLAVVRGRAGTGQRAGAGGQPGGGGPLHLRAAHRPVRGAGVVGGGGVAALAAGARWAGGGGGRGGAGLPGPERGARPATGRTARRSSPTPSPSAPSPAPGSTISTEMRWKRFPAGKRTPSAPTCGPCSFRRMRTARTRS